MGDMMGGGKGAKCDVLRLRAHHQYKNKSTKEFFFDFQYK